MQSFLAVLVYLVVIGGLVGLLWWARRERVGGQRSARGGQVVGGGEAREVGREAVAVGVEEGVVVGGGGVGGDRR